MASIEKVCLLFFFNIFWLYAGTIDHVEVRSFTVVVKNIQARPKSPGSCLWQAGRSSGLFAALVCSSENYDIIFRQSANIYVKSALLP
jgi:hypothetical protein